MSIERFEAEPGRLGRVVDAAAVDENIGVVLVCPNCGSQFRRRYVAVGFLNDARREIERLNAALDERAGPDTTV